MLRPMFACLVGVYLLAMAQPAQAQRVLALMVADVSPAAKWGVYEPNLAMDLIRMRGFFESNVPADKLQLEALTIEADADATPERILADLRLLEPKANDAIVFYFTGHGGIDDRGSYFDLAGGKLYREEVRGLLMNKRPRLAAVITDCCNSRSDGRKQIAGVPFFESPPTYTPLFTALFVRPSGVVDVNSSAPGQSAFFLPNVDDDPMQYGSIFTTLLADWVEQHPKRNAAWDDLIREVSLKVHAKFRAAYPHGAKGAKGSEVQTAQDVFSTEYPGMPTDRRLRAGLYVADNDGQSVRITRLEPQSPATAAYDVAAASYASVPIGGIVSAVNGRGVSNAVAFQTAVATSPQILRLTIVNNKIAKDYLIRLRY